MTGERHKLKRFRDRHGRTLFYQHPNGWRIKRQERDWDARGLGGMTASPKVYWEVKRAGRSRRNKAFDSLRAARDWCDEHTGWHSVQQEEKS